MSNCRSGTKNSPCYKSSAAEKLIMSHRGVQIRNLLYAGVSSLALTIASPEVRAADLSAFPPAMIVQAPPAFSKDSLSVWAEGGAFWTGGGPISFEPFPFRPHFGPEVAAGFDYQWATSPWHVSAQFRYGAANAGSKTRTFSSPAFPSGFYRTNVAASEREHHWLADFAIGRDFGIGLGQAQVKAGIRIAEIKSTLDANAVGGTYAPGGAAISRFAAAGHGTSKFFGVGPRVGIDGSVPLGGPWTFDYLAGVAVLFGHRTLDASGSGNLGVFGINGGGAFSSSDNAAVFNADFQAGLSYWFTPNFKLTASYRFDGYWDALKNVSGVTGTVPNVVNINRFFDGPMVRLTYKN
jgi:hypothetical protein